MKWPAVKIQDLTVDSFDVSFAVVLEGTASLFPDSDVGLGKSASDSDDEWGRRFFIDFGI